MSDKKYRLKQMLFEHDDKISTLTYNDKRFVRHRRMTIIDYCMLNTLLHPEQITLRSDPLVAILNDKHSRDGVLHITRDESDIILFNQNDQCVTLSLDNCHNALISLLEVIRLDLIEFEKLLYI